MLALHERFKVEGPTQYLAKLHTIGCYYAIDLNSQTFSNNFKQRIPQCNTSKKLVMSTINEQK